MKLTRKNFAKKESLVKSLKILARLKLINYLEILNNFSKIKKNSSFSRIKNRCFITSRRGGILNKMKISRIKLKELSNNGLILGVKKLSW